MTIDAHTHNLQSTDGIIAVEPHEFNPCAGQLYAVGIHPWHSNQATDNDLSLLEQIAHHPQVVAIGETGLDSLRGANLSRQSELLIWHFNLAQSLNKPVILHCVRTWQTLLQIYRHQRLTVPCAIHGMRNNEHVAHTLLQAGFWLSFGPRFNDATVRSTPHDRLLIETDDSGMEINQVATLVAAPRNTATDTMISIASSNLLKFLNINTIQNQPRESD